MDSRTLHHGRKRAAARKQGARSNNRRLSLVDETLADSDVWAYSCSDIYPNDLAWHAGRKEFFFLLDPMTPVFPPDRYTGGSGWGREGCLIAIHAGTRWLVGQNLESWMFPQTCLSDARTLAAAQPRRGVSGISIDKYLDCGIPARCTWTYFLLDAPLSEQRMSSTYVAIVCTCPGGSCTNTQLKSLKPAQSLPARARQLMHASFQPCTACPASVDKVIFVTYRTTRLGAIPSPERHAQPD